ncbi:NPCBM/NEW2 domain-containing protein [Micromonospora chersina]|uniref:NPCBM/NEW2 domain-containing protein n=1 Tax=Micromonospora chersina TaxID=47854 RepID=UPI003D90B0EE
MFVLLAAAVTGTATLLVPVLAGEPSRSPAAGGEIKNPTESPSFPLVTESTSATPSGETPSPEPTASEFEFSESPSPSPAIETTTPPEQYLGEIDEVAGDIYAAKLAVNGTTYPHAVYDSVSKCTSDGSAEYDLGRQWDRLTAMVGVSDDSSDGVVVQFEVIADGRNIATRKLKLGQEARLDLSVKGVLRLKLKTSYLQGGDTTRCTRTLAKGVWGDAKLITT